MEDFKNIAPKLSKIKKEHPFNVPDNYFDDFYATLQPKLGAENIPEKQNKIIRLLKPALSLAASFAIIFMLVYWPLSKFDFNGTAQDITSEQEFIIDDNYISIMEEVDDHSLLAFLEEDNQEEKFSDDELVSYLSENLNDYDIFNESE